MIYTSYFAMLRYFPKNAIPVSICGRAPEFYKGIQYKKLAPKLWFFREWKHNHDDDFYIYYFKKEVLNSLSISQVLHDFQKISNETFGELRVPIWEDSEHHIIMICYEKPIDFCHRHLVAKWLSSNNIQCMELQISKNMKNV